MSHTSAPKSVVVIGAGLAGLSSACHLAGRGYKVTVLEREQVPGGRAARVNQDGFAFDIGPTVLTMPELIRSTIRAAGSDPDELVSMRVIDPAYRGCFADGSVIHVRAGVDAMAEEIRRECGAQDADGFLRFAAWAQRLYDLELPTYIDRNYDRWWEIVNPPSAALRLVRAGALRSLHDKVAGFFRDDRLRRLFTFQSLYAGTSPFQARAIYAVISYMDTIAGVYSADGGIGAVPVAMATAAERAGADFRYGDAATEICLERGRRVTGVIDASGRFHRCDAVVVTVEPSMAYEQLLPGLGRRRRRPLRYSPSALVWNIGVRGGPPPEAAHHNIHFAAGWRDAFDSLLRRGVPMPDPSVLVSVPTVSHPELAPPDHTALYVLEPVPNLRGRHQLEWPSLRHRLRERLLARLSDWGYAAGQIVSEHLVDPMDWHAQGLPAGTPFSAAHTFFQSGPFRPANVDGRVRGLVFAGAGTNPGVGVPMVVVSGRLAAARVEAMT